MKFPFVATGIVFLAASAAATELPADLAAAAQAYERAQIDWKKTDAGWRVVYGQVTRVNGADTP